MPKRIVDVANITSAHGWYVTTNNGDTYDPVACWALATVLDTKYEVLPSERAVVGLRSSELDEILGLDLSDRVYMHSSEEDSLRETVVVSTGAGEY